jgi:hypothetical protein
VRGISQRAGTLVADAVVPKVKFGQVRQTGRARQGSCPVVIDAGATKHE